MLLLVLKQVHRPTQTIQLKNIQNKSMPREKNIKINHITTAGRKAGHSKQKLKSKNNNKNHLNIALVQFRAKLYSLNKLTNSHHNLHINW